MNQHNFSITELDEMMPWEREIYLALLHEFIQEENRREAAQNKKLG